MPSVPMRPGWAVRLLPAALIFLSGCGVFHRSRLEDCARQAQALQAQTVQLKDETVNLRARNRDLAQRAVLDSRRIRALEESNRHLEQSVVAYQEEREALTAAFDDLQRRVLAASGFGPAASTAPRARQGPRTERLAAFARAHPGCRFDPQIGVWTMPAALLFEPGDDDLTPGGMLLIQALGRILAEPGVPIDPPRVVSRGGHSPVQLASHESPPSAPTDLDRARALRVRDELARGLGLEAAAVALDVEPGDSGGDASSEAPASIDVHLATIE